MDLAGPSEADALLVILNQIRDMALLVEKNDPEGTRRDGDDLQDRYLLGDQEHPQLASNIPRLLTTKTSNSSASTLEGRKVSML